MKKLGLRLNTKKSVLSPLQRTTYLGVVWDSTTMQACLSPARIDPCCSRESERRPQRPYQRDTFWPDVHETPTVVAQNQGVLPEGKPASDETILQNRAPFTRNLYALKWKLLTSWCGTHHQDPVNCPVGTVLEFLQACFSTGLTHSTLRVYVAAMSAYHAPLGGMSVGKNPPGYAFPPRCAEAEASSTTPCPYEPIENQFLAIKTVLLLALTSLKQVGDLQALSVAPSYLDFAPGMAKAFLYPRAGSVPKVPTVAPQPVVLQAFCPPPFREPDQQKLNCMCPVQALDAYVHRAALWCKADQLLVCYGPPKRGLPASKQTLSRWIVDAISTAYESSNLPSPLGVKAHSTRAMAASKALLTGVPIQDICNAVGWSTPLTFVRFYNVDVRATPDSSVLLP
ncbi:Fumarate hydratase class II [Labeo rohita]|uniref:Fumarate hydratase class II n=1 Tax=Labeo rohita TaxID=84645 RepID=A0ABQ8LSU9_LABRO|nr:Fumarate hydratase class II [Labeo rohita]